METQTQRASFGRRFFAYILDGIIIWILEWPVTIMLAIFGGTSGGAIGSSFGESQGEAIAGGIFGSIIGMFGAVVIGVVAFIVLYFLMEVFTGYTLGKYFVGIRICDEQGNKPELSQALLRFAIKSAFFILATLALMLLFVYPPLFFIVNMLAIIVGIVVYVGYLMALGDKKQALHDKLSKTAVYKKRPKAS